MKPQMLKAKSMGMLSMSDDMFGKADPTALEQAVMGEHFEMLVHMPLEQIEQIRELLTRFKIKDIESIKDIKHAVKKLPAQQYNAYINLIDSFDSEDEAYEYDDA